MFLQNGGDVESLRVQGDWRDDSVPMWYAEAENKDHRKEILSWFPKLEAKKQAEEERKVVSLKG